MNRNLKVLIFSVIASTIPIAYSFVGIESSDGWGAIAQGLGTLFIIPITSEFSDVFKYNAVFADIPFSSTTSLSFPLIENPI